MKNNRPGVFSVKSTVPPLTLLALLEKRLLLCQPESVLSILKLLYQQFPKNRREREKGKCLIADYGVLALAKGWTLLKGTTVDKKKQG